MNIGDDGKKIRAQSEANMAAINHAALTREQWRKRVEEEARTRHKLAEQQKNWELHMEAQKAAEAVKNDQEKEPWYLLPWDALRAVAGILGFGARKYDERNWEKGMDWHRMWRASINHLTAWFEGEDKDPESGRSHLAHAATCVLMLLAYEIRGVGRDTRPKG